MIVITQFHGTVPRRGDKSPRQLGRFQAQVADNCKLWSGELDAWNEPLNVFTAVKAGPIQSMYRFVASDQSVHWFHWSEVVDVVRSPIADNASERTYFTGTDAPRVTDDTIAVLGVWQASTLYGKGQRIRPTTSNTHVYEAQNQGTSGAAEPSFPTGSGQTVVDNEVTWKEVGLEGVEDKKYPLASFKLGVPAPANAPTVALNTGAAANIQGVTNVLWTGGSTSNTLSSDPITGGDKVILNLEVTVMLSGTVRKSGTLLIEIKRGTHLVKKKRITAALYGRGGEPDVRPYRETMVARETPPGGSHTYTISVTSEGDFTGVTFTYDLDASIRQAGRIEVDLGAGHGVEKSDVLRFFDVEGMTDLNGRFEVLAVNGNQVTISLATNQQYTASTGKWQQSTHEAAVEDRRYVVTYVSTLSGKDQEGLPSSPSDIIEAGPTESVDLTNIPVPPNDDHFITAKRIYRTAVGTDDNAEFLFVAELTPSQTTYTDNTKTKDLDEVLPSATWAPPPTDLKGLIELPGGGTAGFRGNELFFSEPYQPHAYPDEYRLSTHEPITAIAAFGNSILVTTQGRPYVVTGVTPGQMSMDKLEVLQPCVSKRGLVDMGYGAIYPSPDGLILVSGGTADLITRKLFTVDEWKALNPASLVAGRYDDRYVAFYDNGTEQGGFILDPHDPQATLTWLDFHTTGIWSDIENGDLYLIVDDGSEHIAAFDGDTALQKTYVWRSRREVSPRQLNLAVAQVHAAAYPVTFRLYANDDPNDPTTLNLIHTQTVTDAAPFRLPGDYLADQWEVELQGTKRVQAVYLAQSVAELKRVA